VKGVADKNFIVLSNFDNISGVEKLAYSLTVLFKPLLSGQSIVVEYFLGEFAVAASWTNLGTASYTTDGGVVGSKTFIFTPGTVFNKIWFRIKLNGGGTNTPSVFDFIMEYLPSPTYKKLWNINVSAADSIKRLDGRLAETTGREMKSLLEKAWWTKSTLDFQDFDYATCFLDGALSSSATTIPVTAATKTRDFPEQGRIKIDDEEILYTGKTPTSFTGCVRGARGTRGVAHTDASVINNAYRVLITDFNTRIPIAVQDKNLEYTVGLTLREV
jgi:hypothetical protein